jgi:hypothetical protein
MKLGNLKVGISSINYVKPFTRGAIPGRIYLGKHFD